MTSSIRAFVLRYLVLILVGYIASRSPLLMKTTPPTPDRPWADGPLEMIPTPLHTTDKKDMWATGATHMALLHNTIFRGYNSILHQAAHVRDADKADFIGYALAWHKFVKTHHDDEEAVLFHKVEELLEDDNVWTETHEEHQRFLPGLAEFHTYLTTLPSPKAFSGPKLLSIMATFQEPFYTHFCNEITHIASLAEHPRSPAVGSAEEKTAAATFEAWGKSTVMKAGVADVVPFFIMNLDSEIEDGRWANWPPMPKPVRWGLANVAGAWHGGWWKFASCDGAGNRRQLYAAAVKGAEEGEGNRGDL